MRGTKEYTTKIANWKRKAKDRRYENESLKKRIKELESSRSNWKSKYKEERTKLQKLKHQLLQLEKRKKGVVAPSSKPKHHSYSMTVILLCIWLRQQGNCSLRCCARMLGIIGLVLELELNFPCANTIQNWEKKLGYWRIENKADIAGKWVVILDESISVGEQKLLLTLGVNLAQYEFGEALCFKDIRVLDIGISNSWKGEDIEKILEGLQSKGFDLVYAVSDGGTNLVKGLKNSGIPRVSDCTHAIGNLLKNQYDKNESFRSFSKRCGVLKRGVMLGKDALIMPPSQRSKGRFLNLKPLSKWASKILSLLDDENSKLSNEQREKLKWIKAYESLIIEIDQQCKAMNAIFEILKKEGLNKGSSLRCKSVLEAYAVTSFFKNGVIQYLDINLATIQRDEGLICCSDIIESIFGKYKNQLGNSTSRQITDACLSIPNFDQIFNLEEIKEAMENTKIIDLKEWRANNDVSLFSEKKRKLFKNTG